MLIAATTTSRVEKLDVQARFLEILPPIERQARIAFRNLRGAEREERIAEVTALAYCMFHRLAVRGMLDMAYPTALARYAIRQTWAGRGAGVQLNVHDVTSAYCQRATGVRVKSLEQVEATNDEWKEMLSDKRATPAEIASCRIDFADWLRLLSAPLRRVAKTLASGESTLIAARQLAFHPAGSRRSGENCSSLGNGFKARLRNPPRNWRALSAERGRWGVVSMENWHSPGRNLVTNRVLFDQMHVSVFVPRGIERSQSDQIGRKLKSGRFQAELRRAIRSLFNRYPALRSTHVTISR